MAIKGSLKEASLPDVLQLLALGAKTGCLAVADRQNFGYIYFDHGRISYASIVNRRDRIGDLLVRNGRLTREALDAAIERQHQSRSQKLGEILVQMGAVSREDLQEYMRVQIEEAVYYLFTWTQGTFNFEAGVRPEQQDFLVQINPESLLLEGARRVDEWGLIEKKIPSFDLIFAADPDHTPDAGVTLSAHQQRIMPLLDGTRDVTQIIEESGLVEFDVGKALYGLLTAGYVRRVGTSAQPAQPKVNDLRVDEHRNLGIAFYRTGMLDEAQREFRRVAELRPDEASAPFFLGLIALKQARWEEAVEVLKTVAEKAGSKPAAVHNLAFAYEQLGQLADAEAAYGEAVSRAREDARVMIGWGVVALKRNDPEVAANRLARARELLGSKPVPPTWYWAASLAAAGRNDLEDAVRLALEGATAHPDHPVLANNLAVLLELTGDLVGAEQYLRGALAEDPTIPQISKNLADLLYRAGRYDEAYESYERAAKLNPDLGDDLYFKLGNIAYKRRDRDRARQFWQRVVALNANHQLARANLETLDAAAVS